MKISRKRSVLIISLLLVILFAAFLGMQTTMNTSHPEFDGNRAYEDLAHQVSLGPRIPGSDAHKAFIIWLGSRLIEAGWNYSIQQSEMLGHPVRNVIALRGAEPPQILLVAHYDTRLYADNDPNPENHNLPGPGANDGASGVAVLLELARVLPKDTIPIGLVFVDAEDNGRIPGWDWILGSRSYVATMTERPQAVIVVDMIGDADLNIYMEKFSDPELTREIWDVAKSLGYEEYFIPELGHRILDDHVPFLDAGIPAVDIIDIDYPYWHTMQDSVDKTSPDSLKIVGDTVLAWILSKR